MSERKRRKTQERQPPVHIPLDFERAVEGLLAVDPKADARNQRATELRRKVEQKAGVVEKHRSATAKITGSDKAARAARKYHENLARHHDELRQQYQAELDALSGR